MRPIFIVVLAIALVVPVLPAGAQTASPLVYAGDSQSVPAGAPLTVSGTVTGGTAPYSVTWSIAGDSSAFADPNSLETTLDTSGLSEGTFTVTLDVTDDLGATASDTVVHHIGGATALLYVEDSLGDGLPDEMIGASGFADGQTKAYSFTVPSGASSITATLQWPSSGNDLDLELFAPNGNSAGSAGQTGSRPEVVTVTNPAAGSWTAEVQPWFSSPTDFTLEVVGPASADLPRSGSFGTYLFGHKDTQQLTGSITGGTAPFTAAWDLDRDGVFESAGQVVSSSFPVGVHNPAFHVTDANGFESLRITTVTVLEDAEHVKRLGCARDPGLRQVTMEHSHSLDTCWMHIGHHTYALDQQYTLISGSGSVLSVEQQFSPPAPGEGDVITSPITIQTSPDGLIWTDIGSAQYSVVFGSSRQNIQYTLGASDEPFKFIRFHEPRSLFEGLSGFLDRSFADLILNAAPTATASGSGDDDDDDDLETEHLALDCEAGDHMENFFDAHPCWFGGVNRYDSPSVFHTYPLGPTRSMVAVAGSFIVEPWRTDDWFLPLLPEPDQVTGTTVFVQSSVDGLTWSTLAEVPALFSVPTPFGETLEAPQDAAFIRLVPDHHPESDEWRSNAPLHHAEAFFVDSNLLLTVLEAEDDDDDQGEDEQ